jgi:hypothetical protein
MSESVDQITAAVAEPDPRFRQFPIPNTVDEVIIRIVEFVQLGVHDAGGPAYHFNVNAAEVDFKTNWGEFVEKQLKRHPSNPWPIQWKNIVHVAQLHGKLAVERAKAAGRTPVSPEDFVNGGLDAAKYCARRFGGIKFMGCWCNDC